MSASTGTEFPCLPRRIAMSLRIDRANAREHANKVRVLRHGVSKAVKLTDVRANAREHGNEVPALVPPHCNVFED